MKNLTACHASTPLPASSGQQASPPRSRYEAPSVTLLGVWGMRTIQLSAPIGIGTPLGSLFHSTEDPQ